jgi:hypothetical protein
MNLAQLVAMTVKTAVRKSKTALQDLSIELARAAVKISDGNKTKSEESQGLKLSLGRRSVSLDAISVGATKFEVPTAQVGEATALLQAAIDDGTFDAAIVECQAAIKESAEAPKEVTEPSSEDSAPDAGNTGTPSVDGLDLGSI